MKTRTLGRNGPEVSAIGFGAMVLSPGIYSPVNDEASIETIHQLLDLGINFIDTADIYGNGHNERLVGRAIRDRRGRVVLATKFGANIHEDGSHVRGLGRRDAVRKTIDASLQRLGLDFVDLYYLHRVDPTTSIEETVGAMAYLVHEGKVRYRSRPPASPPQPVPRHWSRQRSSSNVCVGLPSLSSPLPIASSLFRNAYRGAAVSK